MENIAVGIALFVLIIVVGLIVSLRLSSSGPQRRAVMVAFVAMTLVAALFCVFAMYAAMLWTVPIFAVACIAVPILAYTLMMRSYKQHHPAVTYRAPNEAPRPIRAESLGYTVDAAGMPIATGEYKAPRSDLDAEYAGAHVPATAKKVSASASADMEATKSAHGESASNQSSPATQGVEAMIEEYLMEENEDEDGLFEPELSPTLSPATTTVEETSTMMLTVPFAEGEERYLVVSESTKVPNPILAYRRTTSSRLVPLSSTNRYGASITRDPDRIMPAPGTPVWIPLRPLEDEVDVEETRSVKMPVGPGHAAPSPKIEEPFEESEVFEEPVAPSPSLGFTDFINFVEVEPEPAPTPTAFQPDLFSTVEEPAPASEPKPEPAMAPIVAAQPVPAAPAAQPEQPAVPVTESLFDLKPVAADVPAASVEASAAPVEAPAAPAAPVEAPAAPASQPEPVVGRPAVVPFQAAGSRGQTAPTPVAAAAAAAPAPVEEAPAPAATATYESFMAKAEDLRAKGLFPVAARLYSEAAKAAASHADAHRAQFDEIACYVKCGQSQKARELAGKLRASRVLTRVERIKLDAIERMG